MDVDPGSIFGAGDGYPVGSYTALSVRGVFQDQDPEFLLVKRISPETVY
jgi:hypothetical protein